MKTKVLSGRDQAIAELKNGPWYRRSEVAQLLDVTPAAILAVGNSKAHRNLRATHYIERGAKVIHLYSKADIARLREHFTRPSSGSGRPRIWTLEESTTRRRQFELARYYRRCVQTLLNEGHRGQAAAYRRKADELYAALNAQLEERKATRAASKASEQGDQQPGEAGVIAPAPDPG